MRSSSNSFSSSCSSITVVVSRIYQYGDKLASCSLLVSLPCRFLLKMSHPHHFGCWEVKVRLAVKPVTLCLVNTIKILVDTVGTFLVMCEMQMCCWMEFAPGFWNELLYLLMLGTSDSK